MSRRASRKKGNPKRQVRRILWIGGPVLLLAALGLAALGDWFVHHPREWLAEQRRSLPGFVVDTLYYVGNPVGDLTDALDWTGHDAVYEYDTEAPSGQVLFAGAPVVTTPALTGGDIRVLDRGHFVIGWSDTLRHPLWCAYHVVAEPRYEADRKNFRQDRSVATAPKPGDYSRSGYDRGHMAPNHAIVTRYGEEAQALTFRMSNIAPQTPSLNRGPWRDLEHRIADLWTARYGEIWVIVGCLPSSSGRTLKGTSIDVPDAYYQIVVAQEGMDIRALAVLLPQRIAYGAYPARYIVSIDEIEEQTGLDFMPELPSFIQTPLEAEIPTRLWPVRLRDVFSLISFRFSSY